MTKEYWEELFSGVVPKSALHFAEPMARHTTFAIGGPADLYIEPETEAELAGVLRVWRRPLAPRRKRNCPVWNSPAVFPVRSAAPCG